MNSGGNTLHHQIALLNSPTMIHRNGNPFAMDNRNGNSFLQQNKLNSLPMRLPSGVNQFPTQRIAPAFSAQSMLGNGMSGVQQSLNMLCDVAVGDQNGKRNASDPLRKQESSKRPKVESTQFSADNPVLMQRLSSLSGGFPMPKWGGFKKTKSKEPQPPKQPSLKLGAFPLPPLKEGQKSRNMSPALSSYKELWQTTDHELRKEIFARKLQHGNVKITSARQRHAM